MGGFANALHLMRIPCLSQARLSDLFASKGLDGRGKMSFGPNDPPGGFEVGFRVSFHPLLWNSACEVLRLRRIYALFLRGKMSFGPTEPSGGG